MGARPRVLAPADAVDLVADGDSIALSGGGYRAAAEALLVALEERFLAEGRPRGLTTIAIAMIERSRGGRGGADTGLNRLAHDGLLAEVIAGSFSRTPGSRLMQAVRDGQVAAWNPPMGTIAKWLRAIGAGEGGLATAVGLETFVDPRREGAMMNAAAGGPLAQLIELPAGPALWYPARTIDHAWVKATAADERGNLYFHREAYHHGALHVAVAGANSGGTVVAQVNEIVARGDLDPRTVGVPAGVVDVVVESPEVFEDEQDPVLTGGVRWSPESGSGPVGPREVIARRAIAEIPEGGVANLGAGIPMYDVPEAAVVMGRSDIAFTVEQGPSGGHPRVGGVSRDPEAFLESADMFDLYEGGGPDVSLLSFGEIDGAGNVNVSRMGDLMPGCGGFPNITFGIDKLVFCGTLTTGGLKAEVVDGMVRIVEEGRVTRFVPEVQQVTYNGEWGRARGKQQLYVTERGVFRPRGHGVELVEVAPGIDVAEHIAPVLDVPLVVAPDITTMDERLFR